MKKSKIKEVDSRFRGNDRPWNPTQADMLIDF